MFGWRDEAYYHSDPWRGSWQLEGGGVLVNQSPHQLDLLLWYLGEPEEVFGYWANQNHPYIEVEDTAVAVVRFKNGALGNLVVSNSQNPACTRACRCMGPTARPWACKPTAARCLSPACPNILEPPFNDLWTVPGEESCLAAMEGGGRAAVQFRRSQGIFSPPANPGFFARDHRRPAAGGHGRRWPAHGGVVHGHLPNRTRPPARALSLGGPRNKH